MLARSADFARVDLSLVDRVVDDLVAHGADPSTLMLVGAHCRNVWAQALADGSPMVSTHDVDIGIAVSSMEQWSAVTAGLPKVPRTSSGIAFTVAGVHVDVMPFGRDVEHPLGTVAPPSRVGDPFSVLGFDHVFRNCLPIVLPCGKTVKIPTPEGFGLLKLAAFHDRLAWRELKDAQDLAIVRRWYLESTEVVARLYEPDLLEVLVEEDVDPARASMRLWGRVTVELMAEESNLLLEQWEACKDALADVWAGERHGKDWRRTVEGWVAAFDRGMRL